MNALPFTKVQSIGNDFVIVKAADVNGLDLAHLAQMVCARRFGIGSDGLLVVGVTSEGPWLRMYNPDGTEDFCGNGLRCAGLFLHRAGIVGTTFQILHGSQVVSTTVDDDGSVSIVLPPASFAPDRISINAPEEWIEKPVCGWTGTAVSTGTAHFIVFVDQIPSDHDFLRAGPCIERNELFPEHTSVMFTRTLSDHRLQLRIWERGAGETLGCGTGSVAAAVVYSRKTGLTGTFAVENPGGTATVHVDDWRSPVRSETRPVIVYSGVMALDRAVSIEKSNVILV